MFDPEILANAIYREMLQSDQRRFSESEVREMVKGRKTTLGKPISPKEVRETMVFLRNHRSLRLQPGEHNRIYFRILGVLEKK